MKREERLAYIAPPYVVGSLRCCAWSLLLWGFAIDGSSDHRVMDTLVVLCFIVVGSLHRRSVLARSLVIRFRYGLHLLSTRHVMSIRLTSQHEVPVLI